VAPVSARKVRGWGSAEARRNAEARRKEMWFFVFWASLPSTLRTFRAGFHVGVSTRAMASGRKTVRASRPVPCTVGRSERPSPVPDGPCRSKLACVLLVIGVRLAGTLSPAVCCGLSPKNWVWSRHPSRFLRRIRNGDRTGPRLPEGKRPLHGNPFPSCFNLGTGGSSCVSEAMLSVKLQRAPKDGFPYRGKTIC